MPPFTSLLGRDRRQETSEKGLPGTRDTADSPAVAHAARSPEQAAPRKSNRKFGRKGTGPRWGTETERLPKFGRTGQLQKSRLFADQLNNLCKN